MRLVREELVQLRGPRGGFGERDVLAADLGWGVSFLQLSNGTCRDPSSALGTQKVGTYESSSCCLVDIPR